MHALITIAVVVLLITISIHFAKKVPAAVKTVEADAATVASDVKTDVEAEVVAAEALTQSAENELTQIKKVL
jgi:hypothetical protein